MVCFECYCHVAGYEVSIVEAPASRTAQLPAGDCRSSAIIVYCTESTPAQQFTSGRRVDGPVIRYLLPYMAYLAIFVALFRVVD